jgi:hypothetical protein
MAGSQQILLILWPELLVVLDLYHHQNVYIPRAAQYYFNLP